MSANAPVAVRVATSADLPGIVAIYNDAVLHSTATFDTQPKTVDDQRSWFESHDRRFPIIVAEAQPESGGLPKILGWGSLSRWSDRCGYDATAEVSYYVAPQARGQGLGTLLLQRLIEIAREERKHTLIARMAGGNEASLRLALSAGFQLIGTLQEVGYKFGQRINVHIAQLMLAAC